MSLPGPQPKIFLCYAREDRAKVEYLYERLQSAGFAPWMDVRNLLPGQVWEAAILKAVATADFFMACMSTNSVDKRGFLQQELRAGLSAWQQTLDSDIFLIPIRLEECAAAESLKSFQWVDLFEPEGWERLLLAIEIGFKSRRPRAEEQPEQPSAPTSGAPASGGLKVACLKNLAIIYLSGYLQEQLGRTLLAESIDLLTKGYQRVILNFADVRIVDSFGIAALIELLEACFEKEAKLVACEVNKSIVKLFAIMGISQYIPIVDNELDAIMAVGEAPPNPAAEPGGSAAG